MYKIVILLLLVSAMANAQIISIPDANFKAQLLSASSESPIAYSGGNSVKVDTNDDGEIQISEAMVIDSLHIGYAQITNLSGIAGFGNLSGLDCQGNVIEALDVTNLSNLRFLRCANNQLNSLGVAGLVNLKNLTCQYNHLTSLSTTGLSSLTNFDANNNQLTAFSAAGMFNLKHLTIYNNALVSLNISDAANLEDIYCYNNQLVTIDAAGNTHLKNILATIGAEQGSLTTINVVGCSALEGITAPFHQLSSIDLTGCTSLTAINLAGNHLTTLDISMCPNIQTVYLFDNYQLQTIYAKNGANEFLALGGGLQNLQYVCLDESQLAEFQSNYAAPYPNLAVNSYCSFTPAGNFNTISGVLKLDANNNGCDASDSAFPMTKIKIDDGTILGATFTNLTGNFIFNTEGGNFTITPEIENPGYFTVSPANATVTFADDDNHASVQNFCVTANGVHPDVEVVISPFSNARPGFNAVYQVAARNKGNQTLSGTFDFGYNDAVLDVVSTSVAPASAVGGLITWNYTNLLPFASVSYLVTLHVNSPQETPPVNIGNILNFTANVTPLSSDENPADNTFNFAHTVVGSFDPNDKTCLDGTIVTPTKIGDYLHYNINFENTGTFAAENIVVKDMIDTAKFDISTLQVMNPSHPVTTRITGNKVEFIFKNINLGASQHGNVVFKIKTKSTLVTGDVVSNKADIFFDYNFPVATNLASTVFQTLVINQNTFENAISIYPNPTTGMVNLRSGSTIKSVCVFDIQGRIVATYIVNETETALDVSNCKSGIYYLKMITEKGISVEKLIKK